MSEPAAIRAIIFDMDGVLTDSEPLINEAAVTMFREKGHVVLPEDFLPFVGTGEDRYLGGVAERHGIALDPAEAKRRTYEIYLRLVPEKLRAFPGVIEFVRACRQAGLRVAVASSADRIKIEANLRQIGLPPEGWDAVISGEEVERKKPAPDIFLAAALALGVPPAACVVVEDAVNGITAAKAAGMRCVAVAHTFSAAQLDSADLVRGATADLSLGDILGSAHEKDSQPPVLPPPLPPTVFVTPATAPPSGVAGPWGFWGTAGFSAVIGFAFVLVQTILAFIVVAFDAATDLNSVEKSLRNLESDGRFLTWATFASAPVAVGLSWAFAAARRRVSGITPGAYLGLKRVPLRQIGLACLALLALFLASDAVTLLLERSVVPEVMAKAYQSAGFLPLLLLAIVVVAPVAEEVFFRGFMLPGLSRSRLGGPGAVVLSAATWAAIHLQYDAYSVALLFVLGLLLGAVRLRTGSIVPCIVMHALQNFVATIEIAMAVGQR